MAVGAGFMLFAGAAFVLAPGLILRAFTPDSAVLRIGIALLGVAAIFQLFDGLQVVATGVLRGAGDTRTPMMANLIGHWVLGLPVGYLLCFHAGMGAVGMWMGLSVGLISVGATLLIAWWRTTRYWHPEILSATSAREYYP